LPRYLTQIFFLQELASTYCPPIDPALFQAIVLDFDLGIPAQVEQLRETLDVLKASAAEQEDLPFDPTGTTNLHNSDNSGSPQTEASSVVPQSDPSNWPSSEHLDLANDDASSTHGCHGVNDNRNAQSGLRSVSAEKAQNLIGMFPSITRPEAERILEDCHDNLSRAMDVLLNLAFIEETQIAGDISQQTPDEMAQGFGDVPKSIDGFQAKENQNGTKKFRKKKNKQQRQRLGELSFQSPNGPAPNKWESGKKDIDFISARACTLQREKIASAYHANSMSIGATLRDLADANAPADTREIEDDPLLVTQVGDLVHKYPGVGLTTLAGLIRITNNDIPTADELAETLSRRPALGSISNIITFVSAPPVLEEHEETITPSSHTDDYADHMDVGQAAAAATSHFAARSAALAQASQSARRARSNPLYGGASAYYREVGNEQRQLAMRHLATASDRLVARQSTNCDLDLHGVNVANAVRISRRSVEEWWEALGDQKYIRGGGRNAHGGFKIVCGVGHHSLDRKSHLGPAVWNMLRNEGWRVELDRGSMLVVGVERR
jgi:hypothetical protein